MLVKNILLISLFAIFSSSLYANNKVYADKLNKIYNDKGLSKVSNKYDVSKLLLLAIADVESGFNPYAIGLVEKNLKKLEAVKTYLKLIGVKYVNKQGTSAMSISPRNYQEARKVYLILTHFNLRNFDVGYSQINIKNIEKMKIDANRLFVDTEYVFGYSAKILTDCWSYNNQNIYKAIECYNKGVNRKNYSYNYTQKVIASYKKIKKIMESRGYSA